MRFNLLYCAVFDGLNAKEVEVEASFTKALPSFQITGLAGSSIQEAKQRVQSALLSSNFKFPPLKITINLSPSDLPKHGSFYDLPIALLIAMYNESKIEMPLHDKEIKYFAFGELGLDGRIKDTNSIYPLLFSLISNFNYLDSIFILPRESIEFYSKIPNLKAYFVDNLQEAIEILKNPPRIDYEVNDLPFPHEAISGKKYYYNETFPLDFGDIIGQDRAKRAALIAACGFHNILFEGSAGSGKSMIASRLQYILPPLQRSEILSNATKDLIISPFRPFRNPHSSSTRAAILGSAVGNSVKAGEITLSHGGILFLDELPQFPKNILESLREPLENHNFSISRLCKKITLPSDFMFVGAMNPCPCGNLLSIDKECRCNQKDIISYKNKISEPIWDRIDLCIQMQEKDTSNSIVTSSALHNIVIKSFKFQKQRNQTSFNSRLIGDEMREFCKINDECTSILNKAIDRFGISIRQRDKILRVSRTIADLEGSNNIKKEHLLESLSYRRI